MARYKNILELFVFGIEVLTNKVKLIIFYNIYIKGPSNISSRPRTVGISDTS